MALRLKIKGTACFLSRCLCTVTLLSSGVVIGSAAATPKPESQKLIAQTPVTKIGEGTPQKRAGEAIGRKTPAVQAGGKPALGGTAPFDEDLILSDWHCMTKQPMMEIDAKDGFTQDHLSKSEGRLTFTWTGGTTLHLFLETTSRWRIDAGRLCDVPISMHFTQMSGEPNPYVDKLLAGMQAQADQRIKGNLETCRVIQALTEKELILALPASQGTTLTRCTPHEESTDEK
jgi:hypothetical protein